MSAKVPAELFALMAERVQDYAIFLLDRTGHIMSWNTGARLIKLYEADEIVGRHFSVFYTEEDRGRDWPGYELERALTEGRFEDNGWRVRRDGTRFWANVIITALRDADGKLLAFSKITRDLTERRREEEALRQSEERFRLLVEGVQDYAVYMLSPEGVITSWNLGARRIKGYEAAEVIGTHFSRFYGKEDIEQGAPWAELAMAREHGRAEDEGWRVRKDGTRFWARVAVTALHDTDGRLRGFAKITQDLTQRRHAEALEVAARRIQDFIAVLAHELRNPLAPIRHAAQLLRDTPQGSPQHEVLRAAIDRQSAQLARIVDDLLDVGRVARGTLGVNRKRVRLDDVVDRALEGVRPAMEEGRHRFAVRRSADAVFLDADEVRLTQALTNVLANAARYTGPGGQISLDISVEEGNGTPHAVLRVRDNGRGIEPDLLGSIFGMFVQGRADAGKPGSGLGVGLALARSIVELHHGTLEAASAGVGQGAEFTFRLPVTERRADEALPPVSPARARSGARSLRVLVVDDNVDAAEMLAAMAQSLGHQVHTVHDGPAALEAAEGFRPEVILLDIGMPGMSGFEVARRMRERRRSPEPLIVAITGWGKTEDQERSREAGFDVHLVKPVEDIQLREVLARPAKPQLH